MTSAMPAQRAAETSGWSPAGRLVRRVVEVVLADAIRRPAACDRVPTPSIPVDCGTLSVKRLMGEAVKRDGLKANERGIATGRDRASRVNAIGSSPPPPPSGPIARVAPRMPRSEIAAAQLAAIRPTIPFGLPNLRRNVCPHFYMTGPRGPIPVQTPHLLKAYMRQPAIVARCQVRGGVHLDAGYVTDVCLSARFNQCVFYEEEIAGF